MNAVPRTLETLAADQRFERQLELVREHWASARHLWINTPDPLKVARLGPDFAPDFIFDAGLPGLSTIKPTDDDLFEFAEGGRPALIVPAYADDCLANMLDADAERHVAGLLDLVAVDLGNLARFWRRRGEALVLGAAYLDIAGHEGEPVPVFKTPFTWLRSGGAGVVVLDWDWACDLLLGFDVIAYGANVDDRGDHRPGAVAAREMQVVAPLDEAGFTKDLIRRVARGLGLPMWDKPAAPCLASRIPYFQEVTPEKLSQIERAEDLLKDLGFAECRVRHHGDVARIEVPARDHARLREPEVWRAVTSTLRATGFEQTVLEADGLRSGRLNDALERPPS